MPTGATVLTLSPVPNYIQDTLQGSVCETNNCSPVNYFLFWTQGGVTALDAAIDASVAASPDTKVVVFGYSHGAQVAAAWMAQHAPDPDAPSPENLSFVLMGNAKRAFGGANVPAGAVMPETQYQMIDISRQYDWASDSPNGPFNPLAMANVLVGFALGLHDYRFVDINDPANLVWTVGNTTYVFVPTKNLPLLQPLRWFGLGALADALNEPLKAIVEQGYDRSYLPTAPSEPPTNPDPQDPPTDPVPEDPPADPASQDRPTEPVPQDSQTAPSEPSDFVASNLTVASQIATAPVSLAPRQTPDDTDVLDTTTTSPRRTHSRLDDAVAASNTADTTSTIKSTADGNKVEPETTTSNTAETTSASTTNSTTNGNKVEPAPTSSNTAQSTRTTKGSKVRLAVTSSDTADTPSRSTTDGNKVRPGKVTENQTPKRGNRSPSTAGGGPVNTAGDGDNAAHSDN